MGRPQDQGAETTDHPLRVDSRKAWLPASELLRGDALLTDAGERTAVLDAQAFQATRRVHNLTVADFHTYHVVAGHVRLLVHNCGINRHALSESAKAPINLKSPGGDSVASRSYQKHMGRPTTGLIPLGSGKDRLDMSEHLIDDLLTNPRSAVQSYNHPQHGPVHDFRLPDVGARWKQSGKFIGFLE